jgi:hypothetical protein
MGDELCTLQHPPSHHTMRPPPDPLTNTLAAIRSSCRPEQCMQHSIRSRRSKTGSECVLALRSLCPRARGVVTCAAGVQPGRRDGMAWIRPWHAQCTQHTPAALRWHCWGTTHSNHCKRGPAIMPSWLISYDPGNRKHPNQPTNTQQHHISPAYLLPPLEYLGHTVPCPVGLSGALWASAVRWQPKHQCAAQMGCLFQQAWCRCVPHTPLPLLGLRHWKAAITIPRIAQ